LSLISDGLQIPSLNEVSLVDTLPHGSLVRYRGMVQDMFDPEYFLGVYEEVNASGQKVSNRSYVPLSLSCLSELCEQATHANKKGDSISEGSIGGERHWLRSSFSLCTNARGRLPNPTQRPKYLTRLAPCSCAVLA
jgi:hypothetical protein